MVFGPHRQRMDLCGFGRRHEFDWGQVDLGKRFAKSYKIQVSNDAKNWTNVYTTSVGHGGTERLRFSAAGRYVRMLGLERGSIYGYSLWEFEVYGGALSASP